MHPKEIEMDFRNILALKQPLPINFSYRGNETLQKICANKLSKFFEQNVALWKRSSKQYSFPLHARFLFAFIPFSNEILINYKSDRAKTWEEAALLHFFFLCPTTVEEYRNECRNEIIEWFTIVSKTEGAEWLIVFDSSKAREKKNRGALIERIKSDFAKFTNRIIEIHDWSNITALQGSVQAHLLNALEDYVTYEENSLAKRNDKYTDNAFDFIAFCREQMSLSRLYQSLGIYEQVRALFDELDAMLTLITLHHSPGRAIPTWLASLQSATETPTIGCPLFMAMLKCETLWENITVVELRYIILAHQILNTLRIYEERVQRVSISDDGGAQNLKTEFAITLLRYSQHCLNAIIECMAVFQIPLDSDEMQCWIIVFCLEALQLTSLLTEITHVKQAADFTCSLKLAKCQAMSKLNKRWRLVDWKKLAKWFEDGIQRCGEKTIETNAVSEIRQLLSDQQQFTHYMQKYHESAIALLKHFGWQREARTVGWELAKFLLSSDRAEGALPYLLNFVSELIEDGSPTLLLRETLLFTVNHLEKFPGIHLRELVDFYFILMELVAEEAERIKYCDKLFELSEKSNIAKIRLDSSCNRRKAFSFGFCSTFPLFVATPNETIKFDVKIISHLPKPLKNYKLHCCLKLSVQNGLQNRPSAGRLPHFECIYNETDGINRFACVWKGDIAVRRESIQGFGTNSVSESQGALFLRNVAPETLLESGENIVTITAEASEVGVYYFDYFELEIGRSLMLHCDWVDVPEIETDIARRPAFFIHRKPVSMTMKPLPNGTLLAGVTQHIELEISAGTEPISDENALLQIASLPENDLEFWDVSGKKWSEICNYPLGRLSAGGRRTITVHLCKILRNLSEDIVRNGPPTCVEQVFVKWTDKEWTFTVDFISFIDLDSRTSLLEERVLFETVILRRIDEWLVIPQEAILTRTEGKPAHIPAKLLNPKLTDIQPGSRYRLVWILPKNKRKTNEIEEYELQFTYRVKFLNGSSCSDELSRIYDREYTLFDEFSVPNRTPNYELCAQVLSSQPGAVLCRVDNPCDMIVSLRSLTNRVETVVISVDADPRFWTINERHKLLYVKESGLGQISFSVIPKMVGFLPYPFIAVHGFGNQRSNSDVSHSSSSDNGSDFGPQLSSFVRTNGKQVHVLGAFTTSATSDQHRRGANEKTSRLKEAKSRLTKLFD